MEKSNCKWMDNFFVRLGFLAVGSLVLGGVFQVVLAVGDFWLGFWSSSLLIFLINIVLYFAWHAAGREKALGWMMLTAFILRFAFGMFFAWGLPLFGYEERPQKAGFVFEDAFRREENAWSLAKSDESLTLAFSDAYETDQYGGMLALSALVYRILSPDTYRPALISILAAGVMTLSLPFLLAAMRRRFDPRTVLWAGWILTLYPEGILLGSAQMREPFFILILSILFWAGEMTLERTRFRVGIPTIVISVIVLFLFSYRVALPVIGLILLWMWANLSFYIKKTWIKFIGWGLMALGLIVMLWFIWDWINEVLHWDTLTTIQRSERVKLHIGALPEWLHFPFVLVYGLFQPVLPAAIAAPAPWIWRGLGIFRAVGWYALLPLLVYALFRVWGLKDAKKRRWIVVIVLITWVWIFIASGRAGGDQWDNPRYRAIFLPWMSITAGWAIVYAKQSKDLWLIRLLLIEGIFLAFFTSWYVSRYYQIIPRLEFYPMIGVILFLSLVVIVGGVLWDRRQKRKGIDQAS